jgi:hypothetical protein
MINRSLFGALAVAILGGSGTAQAADDAFCKDYARAAVNQFRTVEKHERCDRFVREGARWSADWRAHYDWCRGVKRDVAWAERNTRKREIEACTRRR